MDGNKSWGRETERIGKFRRAERWTERKRRCSMVLRLYRRKQRQTEKQVKGKYCSSEH